MRPGVSKAARQDVKFWVPQHVPCFDPEKYSWVVRLEKKDEKHSFGPARHRGQFTVIRRERRARDSDRKPALKFHVTPPSWDQDHQGHVALRSITVDPVEAPGTLYLGIERRRLDAR